MVQPMHCQVPFQAIWTRILDLSRKCLTRAWLCLADEYWHIAEQYSCYRSSTQSCLISKSRSFDPPPPRPKLRLLSKPDLCEVCPTK